MAEEYGETLPATCPVDGDNHRIQRVSVIYAAEAPRLLGHTRVLATAGRLAWAGTLFGVAGAAAIWAGQLAGGAAAGPTLIAGFVCFAYALACYGWARARRARLELAASRLPGAMAVWRAAWYCGECDGVFFQPGAFQEGPAGEAVGASVAEGMVITPAAFRRLVRQACGHGRPAGRLAG
jgi:hypothetical protein